MTDHLDTLQAMILAAHADGDADLAAWLADLADDPEGLAALVGDAPAAD